MSKDADIIDLSVATVARRTRQNGQTNVAVPTVIDLQARRESATGRVEARSAGEQPFRLTPGEVWDALNDDRLVVHYQPQFDLRSGNIVAAEALVRLIDTDGQLVYPDCFIDPVEQRDLIVPLGRTIIERVCSDLAAIRAARLPVQRIAVNLSAYQLGADTGLAHFIDQTVAGNGLQYADLEFELTERQSLRIHCEGPQVLNALAERGARVVIDDFGVGYSSVVYLAELPVAAFKLDRALVASILKDEPARVLIDGLIALAAKMGLDVVAEGVETKAQSDYLRTAGCRFAQGYGYARPMPIDDLRELVAKHHALMNHACLST